MKPQTLVIPALQQAQFRREVELASSREYDTGHEIAKIAIIAKTAAIELPETFLT